MSGWESHARRKACSQSAAVDRLETESDKANDVQFTGIVVIVDDEYQRPGRDVSRVTAVHGVRRDLLTVSRLSSEDATRLLAPNATPDGRATLNGSS